MSKFIGYTVGLECNGYTQIGKLVQVEYSRLSDESVLLQTVSARNLGKLVGSKVISADEFADRPSDPYDNIDEARWALNLCGWSLMGDE